MFSRNRFGLELRPNRVGAGIRGCLISAAGLGWPKVGGSLRLPG